ncbi:unnamed protein product [Lasius platythorax]|uniref:Uncharacterized protein n=2 Tax=Lasius platythorax TaxID=488582 RepID=A0AAV2N6M4_9HYME
MNLRENIKKATSLDYIDNNARFFRLSGLSQAAKDRKMNERTVKKPRNIHLVEDSDDDSDDVDNFVNNKVKPTFDKHEISAAIKEVNGGRDLSNKHWERTYMRQLENIINSEKEISPKTSDHNTVTAYSGSQSENLDDIIIKQKHRLFKNAAIMGLVKLNQLSLENLISPSSETSARKEDKLEALHEMVDTYITDNDEYNNDGQVESVPLYEDSEIFVHPLQMGIDKKKFKDIDFTVSRIGKKTKNIPEEYFLGASNDDYFNFVKKEKNTT